MKSLYILKVAGRTPNNTLMTISYHRNCLKILSKGKKSIFVLFYFSFSFLLDCFLFNIYEYY